MKSPKELEIVNKYLSSLSIRYLTVDQWGCCLHERCVTG